MNLIVGFGAHTNIAKIGRLKRFKRLMADARMVGSW
jgi:hypothetical protein